MEKFWEFTQQVLLLTFKELVLVLGVYFFFGLLLYLLARFTRAIYVKSIGQKFDVVVTGWIGVPVHELGHIVFCFLFGHQITEIQLYKPDAADGTLGYVNHSYNQRNIYHKIGNFFIGIGPILLGSALLFFLVRFLVPNHQALSDIILSQTSDLSTLKGWGGQLSDVFVVSGKLLSGLFSGGNVASWQFWVFLYMALCVATHMELSPADLKGAAWGLLSIVIIFVLANIIGVWLKLDMLRYFAPISTFNNLLAGIFTFATLLSALFFVVSYIILAIIHALVHKKVLHPF
jgi:hypothetical protein